MNKEMKMDLELMIIKNPRVNDVFEDPEMKCDKCKGLAVYYAQFTDTETENVMTMCKTCLWRSMEEIDKAISADLAKPIER